MRSGGRMHRRSGVSTRYASWRCQSCQQAEPTPTRWMRPSTANMSMVSAYAVRLERQSCGPCCGRLRWGPGMMDDEVRPMIEAMSMADRERLVLACEEAWGNDPKM